MNQAFDIQNRKRRYGFIIKLYRCFLYVVPVVILSLSTAYGQIDGKAWMDKETNGHAIGSEITIAQVQVKAYDGQGKLVASDYTDAQGHYRLAIPAGQRVRIEFSALPEGMLPSSGSSKVQFATAPAEVSLSLYNPARFMGKNPTAIQAVYATGSLANKSLDSIASLVSYPARSGDSVKYTALTPFTQTGSVWGLAYDRQNQILFSSAIAKRNSALGTQGSGGIYVTDINTNSTKPFVNLDALGFSTGNATLNRDLFNDWSKASHDSLMFSQVGKLGLGGLDISDDSRFLYVMNLYDKHLYRIKLDSPPLLQGEGRGEVIKVKPTDITRFPLPTNTLKGGQPRPFAVKYHNGQVYIGVVCDAQISQKPEDLQAYIYVIDGQTEEGTNGGKQEPRFKEIAHFPLNYTRGTLDYGVKGWYPWTDNYLKTLVPGQPGWMIYPQPIVADIEFDTDGSMIVSLMDRLGHQTGDGQLYRPNATGSFLTARGLSGGDVLRLGKAKKNYVTEQNGHVGARVSAGQSNGEGPGGGEFYLQDSFTSSGTTWHHETATGGLAILPDDNSLLVSVREPDQYVTGGVKWFNNETGAVTSALSVFPGGMKPGYFWKANNVGDIEIATQLPPTEIGDRVWLDNDGDGMQGADEPALPGVNLELYRENQLIGTTISDTEGAYRFSDENIKETIRSRTAYEVRISLKQPIGSLTLTAASQDNAADLDNDAVISPEGYATMAFSTTNPGEHVQHLDAGFLCSDKPQVSAKMICLDNQVQVSLTGYKEQQRYDLAGSKQYDGMALYNTAKKITGNGLVAKASLTEDKPYEATVRVYAPSGCYSDAFVSTINQPGCAFVPENLFLKEPYSIAVYPNPATGPIQLAYRGGASEGAIRIQITDLHGKVIENRSGALQNGYYQDTANLSRQTPGTYLMTVKEGNKHTTKSIVKP